MRSSILSKLTGLFSFLFTVTVYGANFLPNFTTDIFHLSGQLANSVPYLDANKKLVSSAVTPTELGYLSGATSNIQAQINGFSALPLTTLGDTLSENSTPAPVRIAGNITSTKKFYSQTGTGTISALPAWSQPVCSDLSGVAASCSTDTTNASNISSGTLGAARLPNPTASTLGGVESYVAVSHQWINTISTSGVPSSTQPACTDLSGVAASCSTDTTNASNISSGTLGAARLPNPTASTLGGVESLAAVSHNFLTSISTSGVPTQAQPAFTDISGIAGVAQGGTAAGSFTAYAPITGGTTTTGALQSADTGISTVGNVLTSTGASSLPTWQVPGAGTYKAPTVQSFTTTGTQTGWLITISTSTTCAVGDTYTNNANTYTVLYALSSGNGQVLFVSGTGATSGTTLTRATGAGTASITFSTKVAIATYTKPTSPAPLYIRTKLCGGGGGGQTNVANTGAGGGGAGGYHEAIFTGGSLASTFSYSVGTGGATATSGVMSTFGNNQALGGTGATGANGVGGAGGQNVVNSGTVFLFYTGNAGGAAAQATGGGSPGGTGGAGAFGGQGAGTNVTSATGAAGLANSCSGGNAGGETVGVGGAGGSGRVVVEEYYQ